MKVNDLLRIDLANKIIAAYFAVQDDKRFAKTCRNAVSYYLDKKEGEYDD